VLPARLQRSTGEEQDEGLSLHDDYPRHCFLAWTHQCARLRIQLIGREERLDEDAFAVVPASREEIDNLLRAVGQVAILKQCVAKVLA
jgi:hypothetical protein